MNYPKVIFEDDFVLVLDKPTGWVVDEAKSNKGMSVIQAWLREKFDYEIAKDIKFRSGIVHRLDKETSGILIVAKTPNAFKNLQAQFKSREVKKTYLALVHGIVEPKEGKVIASVGRLPWRRDRFGVLPGGRSATTEYKAIKEYDNIRIGNKKESFTFLELYPKTGRTHQIRIHFKYLGHPIVSDEFYAGRKTARNDRKWCPRLFLHAKSISFKHPISQKTLVFSTPLPSDLRISLKTLDK